MVKRSESYKENQRQIQTKKGDFWAVYQFKKRFTPEALPELDFWTFKKELSVFLKEPEKSKYIELFLAIQNELEIMKKR